MGPFVALDRMAGPTTPGRTKVQATSSTRDGAPRECRHLKVMGVSERFACRVTGQNRTTQRRDPVSTIVADPEAGLRAGLRDYAKDHPTPRPTAALSRSCPSDEHTSECLGGLVERLVTGEDLIDELDRLAEQRSYPAVLLRPRPRARPHAMADWPANASGCPIPPGRAVPQRLLESFNSRIRDESSTSTSSGHGPTPAS
jgi:hypothetical protein